MGSELHERLRHIRKVKNLTQQNVGDWFGITREAVAQWESEKDAKRTTPSTDQLKEISRQTGAPLEAYLLNNDAAVDMAWGQGGVGKSNALAHLIRQYDSAEPARDDEILISESRIKFSGGPGYVATYETVEDSEPATYRRSWFQKERINPERARRFRVTGRSMQSLLWPNDSVLANLDETSIRDGDVYVFRHEDQLRVKALILREDKSLILRSINRREFPDEIVPAKELDDQITVIGKVRDKSGRGGLSGWKDELREVSPEYLPSTMDPKISHFYALHMGVTERFPNLDEAKQAALILKLYQWGLRNPKVPVSAALELASSFSESG